MFVACRRTPGNGSVALGIDAFDTVSTVRAVPEAPAGRSGNTRTPLLVRSSPVSAATVMTCERYVREYGSAVSASATSSTP